MEFTRKRKRVKMEEEDDAIAKINEGNIYTLNNHIYFSMILIPNQHFNYVNNLEFLKRHLKWKLLPQK